MLNSFCIITIAALLINKLKDKQENSLESELCHQLDKQREHILILLAKGWEVGDIAREVGVTVRQVSAVKAHITMRSYSNKPLPHSELMTSKNKKPLTVDDVSQLIDKAQTNLSPIAIPVGAEISTNKETYWDPDPDYGSPNPH